MIDRNVRGKQSRLGLCDSDLHLRVLCGLPSERRRPQTICIFNGNTYVTVKVIHKTEFVIVNLFRNANFPSKFRVFIANVVYRVPFMTKVDDPRGSHPV